MRLELKGLAWTTQITTLITFTHNQPIVKLFRIGIFSNIDTRVPRFSQNYDQTHTKHGEGKKVHIPK